MNVSQKSQRPPYVQALDERVIVFDGAMGTQIDTFSLTAEDYGGEATYGCRDYLVITRPDVIGEIHRRFADAGADVMETCTFQASRLRLDEWGLADKTYEINSAAARLARQRVDEVAAKDGRPRFVAGSIGPTGKLPSSDDPELSNITFDELVALFEEQSAALIDGGVDLLLIETSQDILEVKAAMIGCKQAIAAADRPVALQVQVTLDTNGRMLLGTDIASALTTIESMGADVIGMNCSTGPEHMRESAAYLTAHTDIPISCVPNAGLPINVDGDAVYPLEPDPMAASLREFVDNVGVRVVGGCCGSTPDHIRQIASIIHSNPVNGKKTAEEEGKVSFVSSGIRATALQQDPRPLIIGERVNSLGSRKIKRLLIEEDYDTILQVARDQVDFGAHVLDVCVAMTERSDELEQMVALVKKLAMGVEAPLVFDSTDPAVIEAALKIYPGRAIINSTSLEGGRGKKIDEILPLAAKYGAAVVCMAIDEEGMAHEPQDKLRICKRIYDIATQEYGLPPDALLFDVNTFPITTGQDELREEGKWTIEGIKLVKEHLPGALTTLGVSNLSFGVDPNARATLNSIFVYHAVQAGLDAAMVNPQHITPYADIPQDAREICEDLIFNRRDDALGRFIEHFQNTDATQLQEQKADPTEGMTVDEKIHYKIVQRKREGIAELIDETLANRMHHGTTDDSTPLSQGDAAVDILNNVLLPAMKEVGDRFGKGEIILPFVLQSAEVMKRAVTHLEQYMEKKAGSTKGTVVLATVYGDVHDIGKNLVNTVLNNNGYTVHDIGKQVPVNTIIEKAIEYNADAIGLSALLVSTSKQMPLCVQELDRRGLNLPVLIGGAAINKQYGHRTMYVDDHFYGAGAFYCKDAFEGLETMDKLIDPAKRTALLESVTQEAAKSLDKPLRGHMGIAGAADKQQAAEEPTPTRSASVSQDMPIPVPPFWGGRVEKRIAMDDMFNNLDRNTLYRLHWGAKNAKGDEWKKLQGEFDERLRKMRRQAADEGWFQPAIAYGYYPVQSDGNDLIVYNPATVAAKGNETAQPKEIARFSFPRQADKDQVCLSDYFASVESDRMDVAAFQVVTVGRGVTELCERLQKEGDYSESFYIHGLGVALAEALAEHNHKVVRRGLGLGENQGKRYSWGYPACPELADHQHLTRMLPMEEVGVALTTAHQLVPEQSTAAIVVHHPQAKYFSVKSLQEVL